MLSTSLGRATASLLARRAEPTPAMLTPELVARYSTPVPRYTSYPTAPTFNSAVTPDRYRTWLSELRREARLSLYIHVPFCQQLCWFCGCSTRVARRHETVAHYVDLLISEIELVGACLPTRQHVGRIHLGGGSPTMLEPRDLERLRHELDRTFVIDSAAEIGVEIDPRRLTADGVAALRAFGVNRASLGVQDFAPIVQRAVNRVQSYEETAAAAQCLRNAGINGVNIDLMYGLPHQTEAGVERSARLALSLDPNRLAVFGYAHVPWLKKHQRAIASDALPDSWQRFRQSQAAAETIAGSGFARIGFDHFARPDDPLAEAASAHRLRRNFQGYTDDDCDVLIGLGASAIGELPQGYVQNESDVRCYGAAIAAGQPATVRGRKLADDDRLRRSIIERLMCDFGVHLGEDAPALADSRARLDAMTADGLVRRAGGLVSVTPLGRPFVRHAAAAFDRYLAPGSSPATPRYSAGV
jgi:oxygen-independent coproporphyrinogen-3 oxidase